MYREIRKDSVGPLIYNALFSLICLVGIFIVQAGVQALGPTPLKLISMPMAIGLCITIFISFLALFIFNAAQKRYKPSLALIIILGVLFIVNIITLLLFKNNQTFNLTNVNNEPLQIVFNTTNKLKMFYIAQYAATLLLIFLLLDVFPKIFADIRLIYLVCIVVVIFALVSAIISYATETDFYVTFLKKIAHKDPKFIHPKSIFMNKNSYAAILYVGLIGSLFLHYRRKHFWWYIFAFFFMINATLTFCKIYRFVAPFTFFAYFFAQFFLSFKKHKVLNISVLSTVVVLIAVFVSSVVICAIQIDGFNEYLVTILFKDVEGAFTSRLEIWKRTLEILNQTNWLTGVGFHNYGNLIYYAMDLKVVTNEFPFTFAHNATLEAFGNGGIILALVYILFLAYAIYLLFRVYKEHKSLVWFEIILIISLLCVMAIESGSFVLPFTVDYAFFTLIIYVPLINCARQKGIRLLL